MSLEDASCVTNLHCCSDPPIDASARAGVACFGADSCCDAVKELRGGGAKWAQRFESDGAKIDTSF